MSGLVPEAIVYGGMVVWSCIGVLLGLRSDIRKFFVISIGLVGALVVTVFVAGAEAEFSDPATGFAFAVVFAWLPALWTAFFVSAGVQWARSALGELRTRK